MSGTRGLLEASRNALARLGMRLAAVLLIGIALAFASDVFLTETNLLNVLRQAALLFLIASGLTLVILTAGLDLSVGANLGMSACLAASALKATGSPLLGALTGVASGLGIGLANGLLVTALRIPPFIATYGMLWVLHGLSYYYMAGDTIYGFPPGFREIGSGYALGVPINRRLILVYTLSGAMAGLASLIFLARLNSAEGDIGESLTLPAIAAVLIGGASLFGGVGTIGGTLIGALILTLVLNGMNLLEVNANWQPFVTGAIVLIGVLLDMWTRRRTEAKN